MSPHAQGPQRPPRTRRWEPATVATLALAVVLLGVSAVFLAWGRFDSPARPSSADARAGASTTQATGGTSTAPSLQPDWPSMASADPAPATPGGATSASASGSSPTPAPAQRIVQRTAPIRPKVVVDPAVDVLPPLTFRVSSFNMLGASHTVDGAEHRAAGPVRARWGSELLRGAGVTVAGLQELEPSQYAAFGAASPGWDAYPGTELVHKSTANSIVWDSSVWELVEAHTILIPYFHGAQVPMPYIELKDRKTGRTVWFANFHNPADVHGPAARFRAVAVTREAALANELTATGEPLVMTGDMNDREAYFCPMTARTTMHAALGGSTGTACTPPAGHLTVDWIMGSPDVAFSNYHEVTGGLVVRTSDHHLLWTDATVSSPVAPAQ